MTEASSTKTLKALLIAAALLTLTLFAAANFVLVDVRLPGGMVRLRLAWVAVVPSACAFCVGLAYARLRQREASPTARRATGVGSRRDPAP